MTKSLAVAARRGDLNAYQACLADGWTLLVGYTDDCTYCPGWWATASTREDGRIVVFSSETGRPRGDHHDGHPALALRELAVFLPERAVRYGR